MNALFGIEASNEYRRDTVLTSAGIEFEGAFGIANAPKNPKAWYQFGQRIAGWSRIAQICVMQLASEHVEAIINGDTDSVKFLACEDKLPDIERELSRLSNAVDKAKKRICSRVAGSYPDLYDELKGIGHYIFEFESDSFCASWNKAYCTHDVDKRDGKRHYHFTLAGIPTKRRTNAVSSFIGLDGYADRLDALGYSFAQVCNIMLGYNVTFSNDVIRLNARKFPVWGSTFFGRVVDYLGNESIVTEPNALAIYPMSKTVNDVKNIENLENMKVAVANNPDVNTARLLVHGHGIDDMRDLLP